MQSTEELLVQKFNKYEEVTRAFKKYFHQDDISKLLNQKVDKITMNDFGLKTVKKNELLETNNLIENLNERVKHLANI